MATMPAFLRRTAAPVRYTETTETTRRTATVRAERDPFELRALPLEDVFFFSKIIDNSRLVREQDPKSHGACWSAIGTATVVLGLLTGVLAPRMANTLAGYKLEALRAEERRLTEEQWALDLQEAKLLSPEKMERLAHKQNLVTPASNQVFHLDKPDGAVAMVK